MQNNKGTIMIVDDDEEILKTFKEILQLEGYSVDIAKTGKDAIEKSKNQPYDLALLDIKLPDMEGTQLLIKMHKGSPRMMKIMITGFPSKENAIEAVNLGADAFLVKPVKSEELLKVVKEKFGELADMERLSQEKVSEWIEQRIRKLE